MRMMNGKRSGSSQNVAQTPASMAILLLLGAEAFAQDKSQFTFFNPTPVDQMREMNTDRPDATESPYTVDAGHFQVEFSLVEYTYDRTNGVETEGFSVLPA